MWCPKCAIEYRAGFVICSECGSILVSEKPQKLQHHDLVFLYKLEGNNSWEIPELLRRAGIDCYTNTGNKMFSLVPNGANVTGDVFVERSQLERAKICVEMIIGPPQRMEEADLIEAYEEYMNSNDEAQKGNDEDTNSSAWKVFILLSIFIIVFILYLIFLR